jgi:hypothetical protein
LYSRNFRGNIRILNFLLIRGIHFFWIPYYSMSGFVFNTKEVDIWAQAKGQNSGWEFLFVG